MKVFSTSTVLKITYTRTYDEQDKYPFNTSRELPVGARHKDKTEKLPWKYPSEIIQLLKR